MAEEIETLLASDAVTYAQASRLVLDAAGAAAFTDPSEAFYFAREQNWLPRNASPHAPARLNNISLLLMQSFGLRGGILFTLTGAPRFAYREMVHMGILHGRISPVQMVSGDTLLYLVGRFLGHIGEDAVIAAEMEQQRAQMEVEPLEEEYIAAEPEPQRARFEAERLEAVRLAMERLAAKIALEAERLEAVRLAAGLLAVEIAQKALAEQIYIHLEALQLDGVYALVTEKGVIIRLSGIQFFTDPAEIPLDERIALYQIGQILRDIPARMIMIAGHTALTGTGEGRMIMSTERAQAVAAFLVFLGVREAGEIITAGYGAERPIAGNDTPEGMAANQRVEIIILGD